MDYIHTLLIMEDNLNDEPSSEDVLSMECNSSVTDKATAVHVSPEPGPSACQHLVDWCMCRYC